LDVVARDRIVPVRSSQEHAPMTVQPTSLPELAEADAPASVRAIYAQLREAAQSPIAALIWRHIATHPGTLEACWDQLRPLAQSGCLAATAWRVARETVPSGLLPRIAPRAQALLGLQPADAATLAPLIEAYNRANPVNLLAVLTLLARLEIDAPTEPAPPAAPTATAPPPITLPLPRMTPPDEMSAEVRWLLNDLRFGDTSALDTVVPSLYRHLTDWPAYLAVLHIGLAPRFRDGTLAAAVARVEQAMAAEAAGLARRIAPVPALAANPALQATMRRFAGGFIPMMIVIGHAMAAQLGEAG
jgi:hypothetical protein